MLQVDGVSVRFGGLRALQDVSIDVPVGHVTGLIGPNGAGKTTLFNVITGFQRASTGRVTLEGTDITGLGPQRRAALGIARTFQRLQLFGSLSIRENVMVALEARRGRVARGHTAALADDLLQRVGVVDEPDAAADTLSTGKARLVELARGLACQPRVLLLDEISSGLDADESRRLGALLRQLAEDGIAVLLVEHDMDLVMSVCDRIYVLDFGVMIADGPPAAVAADERVRSAYLGEGQWEGSHA
jgi:branched-chain amino acid transport system ATP-binding protein